MQKKDKYNVAVVGATGNVGRAFLDILHERNFPVNKFFPIGSYASLGKEISFGDDVMKAYAIDNFDFAEHEVDIVFGATDAEIAESYVLKAVEAGALVIDNSSHFRLHEDVALVVPEVNLLDVIRYDNRYIIANPNCCVIPLVVALKPLDNAAKIKRIILSTYQSTSGAGKAAMDELYNHTKNKFSYQSNNPTNFSKEIAFNIIPHIDVFEDNLYTREENKIILETKKILGDDVEITVTSVRVPTFVGHSLSINVEFEKPLSAEEAAEILSESDGVAVIDLESDMLFATALEAVGEDAVFVSRIRNDYSRANSLNMWVVSDNLRKGAALNAIQIAEELIQ